MSFSFLSRTVYKTKSKISGEIVVKEQFGRHALHVGNMIQSGGIVKGIWKKPLRQDQGELSVSNCLILGLGGGTVVQLIKAQYPEAKIVGIEIDKEIVKISKKYFGLNKVKDLKIINDDAINWVKKYKGDKFDMIIVDLYIGGDFQKKAMSDKFLKKIKKLLSKEGIIIFNWLKNKDGDELIKKLEKNFLHLDKLDTPTNLFLFAH